MLDQRPEHATASCQDKERVEVAQLKLETTKQADASWMKTDLE